MPLPRYVARILPTQSHSDGPQTWEQPRVPNSEVRRPSRQVCDVCEATCLEIHCKIICRKCGYTRDCSDT